MSTGINLFDKLPDELLQQIFEWLLIEHQFFLQACSLVCHRFYRVAIPALYREMPIMYTFESGEMEPVAYCAYYKNIHANRSKVASYLRNLILMPHKSSPHPSSKSLHDCVQRTIEISPALRTIAFHFALDIRATWPGDFIQDLDLTKLSTFPPIESLEWLDFTPTTFHQIADMGGFRNLKRIKTYYQADSQLWESNCRIPTLKSLTMSAHVELDKMEPPVRIAAPLRELCIVGHGDHPLPLAFLSQYTDTLEKLIIEVHAACMSGEGCLQAADVQNLANVCPKLTDLTLHVRANYHTKSVFDEIAKLPHVANFNLIQGDGPIGRHEKHALPGLFDQILKENPKTALRKISLGRVDPYEFTAFDSTCTVIKSSLPHQKVELELHWHDDPPRAVLLNDEETETIRLHLRDELSNRRKTEEYKRLLKQWEDKHGKGTTLFDVLYA